MSQHTRQVIRLLRRFDGKHSQSINKAALQPFISTFITLSHMPALQKAFEDYGLFADQVKQYNCNDSPISTKKIDYLFDSRGSSFKILGVFFLNGTINWLAQPCTFWAQLIELMINI